MIPEAFDELGKLFEHIDAGRLPEGAAPRLAYPGHKVVCTYGATSHQHRCLTCRYEWQGEYGSGRRPWGGDRLCPSCKGVEVYVLDQDRCARWSCITCKFEWDGEDGTTCPSCGHDFPQYRDMPIFPTLIGRTFARINLDEEARAWLARLRIGLADPNPLINPAPCTEMLREAHARMRVDFSYGGWLEDRSALWRGSYLDKGGLHLHLGVDWNVPAGTPVAVDRAATVLRVDCDSPEEHGWGTRIILRPSDADVVLVFAHLAPQVNIHPQDEVPAGTEIGAVGTPTDNGGWYPHLHVQAIRKDHYDVLLQDGLRGLDGYGATSDRDRLASLFPDPSPWIRARR